MRDLLAPMSDLLVHDASPDVRRLAIGCLEADSRLVPDLALRDPDVTVRRAALVAFASSRQDIAKAALADPDEDVKALAVEAVVAGSEQSDLGDLAANVQAWMETGGAHLAATCAAVLPQLSGAEAEEALCRIAADTDRPQEARIAALRSLSTLGSEKSIATLRNAATDPIRQVRTSALAALAELAKEGPERHRAEVREVLVSAIRGDLSRADALTNTVEPEPVSSIGASKVEDAVTRGISITPEGEIVPMEDLPDAVRGDSDPESNVIEGHFPRSTLQAIQTPVVALSRATDTLLSDDELALLSANKHEGRRQRVAVDGPDDIGTDLSVLALRIVADCPGEEIEQALAEALDTADAGIRVAAFEAIAQRSENTLLSADLISKLTCALGDPDPRVRGYASRAVARACANAADYLSALLDDPDAIVRSIALKSVAAAAPGKAVAGFRDGSTLVRRTALESVLEHGNIADLEKGLRICLEEGWTDSLAEAGKRSTVARSILISVLAGENKTHRQTHCALEALAATGPPA